MSWPLLIPVTQCQGFNYSRNIECFKCHEAKAGEYSPPLHIRTATDSKHFALASTSDLTRGNALPGGNHGQSDMAGEKDGATPFLLFRNLETSVNEQQLAQGARKLVRSDDDAAANARRSGILKSTSATVHAGARPDSIKRVLLIRKRATDESWGFGFVEWETAEVRA